MSKLIPIACLALLGTAGGSACAQEQGAPAQQNPAAQASPADPAAVPAQDDKGAAAARRGLRGPRAEAGARPDTKLQQVTISGSRANDIEQRRMSTAAKMIFGREELDRNGDSNVGEILKRLPGVTMGGAPGRGGGGVRMRGLGNGYTQMLVNGERPPPGFSLESLSPDQVERIEVMRGPVAEHSTQAIAGTINIVLREGYQQKDIQLRVADSIEQGRHGPNVSLTVPGKAGKLAWTFNGSVMQHRQHNDSATYDLATAANGDVLREQQIATTSGGTSSGVHLTPRLQYKFDNNDTLTFQPFLVFNRNRSGYDTEVERLRGSEPLAYAASRGNSSSESTFLRGFGNWVHRMDGGAKLDVKFGGGGGRSDSSNVRNTFDADGKPLRTFVDSDQNRSHNFSTGGKYSRPLGEGHLLAAGWDVEAGHLEQVHVAEDDGGALFDDSGASLTADTRRVAVFAQDEWDINKQWSMYLGLRWEGIRTTSTSSGRDVKNASSVFSPVLHTVWRIPGHDKDQVRASLTQSYRAPPLNDLIAAPSFSTDNQRTRPDRMGNPELKPELAKGIDLAYEHYLGKSGILSASAFARDIDNLMRRETTLRQTSQGPRWVSSPTNIGHARTSGIELEAKFQLAELVADAPNLDFRSNYSRFWSNVDGIPGPNNRLDQQAKETANLGLDYRMKALPLTLGGNLNWTPAILVQTSLYEQASTGNKRQLDMYGLWKFGPQAQLRLSANNLAPKRYDSGRIAYPIGPNGSTELTATSVPTYTTVGVRLELKL
ncbi:MAG: TonB-dependent receptor domain-containing protein [Massilia sp.]